MHNEIFSQEQIEILPCFQPFKKSFGLVGGTAIALHLGHRRSIDFDFFSFLEFKNASLKKKLEKLLKIEKTLVNKTGEYTFFANKVKITFYNFPYEIDFDQRFEKFFIMPNLLTLAAMKAFALGQRAKWKDYVDLFFILENHYSLNEIVEKGKEIFKQEFNAKLFRTQLAYFNDINYEEAIEFMPGFSVSDKVVKKALIKHAIS